MKLLFSYLSKYSVMLITINFVSFNIILINVERWYSAYVTCYKYAYKS